MKRPLWIVLLVGCSLAGACSRTPNQTSSQKDGRTRTSVVPSASAAPSGPPPLSKEEVVSLMESLGRIHVDHGKDCGRLTTELTAFEASRAGELVRAAPAAYAAIEAEPPLAERLGRAMEAIMTVSMACANEPRFAALHARRKGNSAPPAPSASAPPSAAVPSVAPSR